MDPPLGDKPQSEYWEICILLGNSVHKRIKNGGIVSKIENLYSPFSKYWPAGVRRRTCFSSNFSNLIIELVKINRINRPGSRNSPSCERRSLPLIVVIGVSVILVRAVTAEGPIVVWQWCTEDVDMLTPSLWTQINISIKYSSTLVIQMYKLPTISFRPKIT